MPNEALPAIPSDDFERWILSIEDRVARAAVLDRIDPIFNIVTP